MQPTNFPALVNNFSNEKQNKNRKKIIIKKGQGSFRSRIPPVGYFSFFSTETTKPVKKTHNGRAATGTNPIKREKIFNFFFFFSFLMSSSGPLFLPKNKLAKTENLFHFAQWHDTHVSQREKKKKFNPKSFFSQEKFSFLFKKFYLWKML